jgi:pimeloyl-ACP methyl ester carboxylesterase
MLQTTSPDGTTIAYSKNGQGPALLLVHGTTADHRRWAGVSPQLEQHFTVYAMDRRGRGGSGDSPTYQIEREFEDVAAVVEAIGQPVYVLAHSYGAVCSLEGSLLTDGIERLILYEPPIPTGLPQYPAGIPDQIQALTDNGQLEKGLELFLQGVVRMPDHELAGYRKLPMWTNRVQLAPTIARDIALDRTYRFEPQKFSDHDMPILLLLGGDSPPLFQEAIVALESALPNSQTFILPGQQHIAMDTNPALFVEVVLDFLLD